MDKVIYDSKYVDVKYVEGDLVLAVPAKTLVLAAIKPLLEKVKAAIPGDIDDALIDKIIAEIEKA